MKKLLGIMFLMIIISVCGCGTEKTAVDYGKMTPRERVIHLHENYYIPLKESYYGLVKEYERAATTCKTIEEFNQLTGLLIEKKYGPYIMSLHVSLSQLQDKEMQEIYPYVSALDNHLFWSALDLIGDLKRNAEIRENAKGDMHPYIGEIEEYMLQDFEEADLKYQHEYSKIVNGKGTYAITVDNFNKLEQGMTLLEVIRILKMPPTLSDDDYEDYYWVVETPDADSIHLINVSDLRPSDKYIKVTFKEVSEDEDYKLVSKELVGDL